MEKLGWFEFRAEGLSLERLLNQCAAQKVRLRRMRRVNARTVAGSVAAGDLGKLKTIADARGWRLSVGRARGPVRLAPLTRRRALLPVGALVFGAFCWALLSCVWFIDVRGAGAYSGEVERVLAAHDVRVGRFVFALNIDAIEQDLERQLTGVAWVNVHAAGVRLEVRCVLAKYAERGSALPGDIVAARDGIVSSVTVAAGTAAVRPGDAVRKGQVLVRGEERGWDGEVIRVRAEASVMARTWYTAHALAVGTLMETVPVGDPVSVRTLHAPFYALALDEQPVLADFERETTVHPIAGPFPVWMSIDRYQPVESRPISRDEADVRAEAALAATRLAQESAGGERRVVDKWVEYSMINDGSCLATAVLEAVEEIAVAP